MNRFQELAEKYYAEIKRIREHLHQHPEVSGEEYETCKYVQAELDKLGIKNHVSFKTGVVGLIEGGKPGKTVLLRGDMDALPIDELADVAFKSKNAGVMHACGHDGHTAGLLGAAMILNEIKDELHGNVKLMFQPTEEINGGALPMIEEGLLENPKVDAAFGIHLWGPVAEGKVAYKNGPMMAAPDLFEITVKGRGSHAAMPNLSIDPVVITAQIIQAIQTIVSRNIDPVESAVISICSIHGGEALNVVPQEVKIGGTIRTLTREMREYIPARIQEILKGFEVMHGCVCDFNLMKMYPPLINNEETNKIAISAFSKIVGEENVFELAAPTMGGEDFSFLGEYVPSSYLFVGIAEEGKPEPIHHHPEFAWNTEVLKTTSAAFAQTVFEFLNGEAK